MPTALALAFERIGKPKILVVGDTIYDHEIHLRATRFAQEAAHCPVWLEERAEFKANIGGAGAVARMAEALGAQVTFVTVENFAAHKKRHFIGDAQVLRIDADAEPIPAIEIDRMIAEIKLALPTAEAVVVGDYNKGACTDAVSRAAIDGANARGIPCIVDPAHGADWNRYIGCTAIKCNHIEDAAQNDRDVANDYQVTTIGKDGIRLRELGADEWRLPCRQRRVVDVTGAGDMVLAALGVCIAGGMSWYDACKVANAAAGCKVERRGAVPVPKCEVVADLVDGKLLPAELLYSVALAANMRGPVVWANGCFDGHGLHRGHLYYLTEAKKHGKTLIVGVNGDQSVRELKGRHSRPISPLADRLNAVAALECVDYVVAVSDEDELGKLIASVAPAVLCKGGDWRGKDVIGSQQSFRLHFVDRLPGYATSGQ